MKTVTLKAASTCPAELLAMQLYCASSAKSTEQSLRTDLTKTIPFSSISPVCTVTLVLFCIGEPSFSHSMVGVGSPVATQVSRREEPKGVSVLGGTITKKAGSKSKGVREEVRE